MRLDFQASERAANVFVAFKKFKGLTDEAYARRLDRAIAPSTLHRLLTTASGFTLEHCLALAEVVTREYPCSVTAILHYIAEGEGPCPPIDDLVAAHVFELKDECLTKLEAKLSEAECHALLYEELGTVPSPQFLTEPVMKKLCRWLARSFEDHFQHRYELLKRFARARTNRFMFGAAQKPLRTDILMSRSQISDFLFRLLPGIGCTRSERDALVEFWIFDCLYNRNVHFGFFDPPPTTTSGRMPPVTPIHEAVTMIDRRYALLRQRGMPGTLWIEPSAPTASAPGVIQRYASQIDNARERVCYDLDNKFEVEQQLAKLLSPRTWAYRSLNAKMFRSVHLN